MDIDPRVATALRHGPTFATAPRDVVLACLPYITEAIDQVWDAPDKATRRAMLGKLPPHIRAYVEEWVGAQFGHVTVYASDLSDASRSEAAQIPGKIVEMPLWGSLIVVRKKGA